MIRNKVEIILDEERLISGNTDMDKLLTNESVNVCLSIS